jgi:ParB-like chromosome segregation protein Spo0J
MIDQSPIDGIAPDWRRLTAHPLAELFPLMFEAELAELADDIKKNGLQEDIVLYEGQILDGRNRHAACLRCGIEPRFVDFTGDDPLAFIISMNLHRRHLSQAAKAEVVSKVLKATPEKSDRAIGRLARVDGKTVAARRAELEASAEIPHLETREDSKGRIRPAHKAPSLASRAKGEPLGLTLELSRRAALDSQATIAFMGVLRDGDIHRHLNELLGMLRDEKERIAVLPTSQRESLARGFLVLLDIAVDQLRSIVSVPAFEGALLTSTASEIMCSKASAT